MYTFRQFSAVVGMPLNKVKELVDKGLISSVQIGSYRYIVQEELDRFQSEGVLTDPEEVRDNKVEVKSSKDTKKFIKDLKKKIGLGKKSSEGQFRDNTINSKDEE